MSRDGARWMGQIEGCGLATAATAAAGHTGGGRGGEGQGAVGGGGGCQTGVPELGGRWGKGGGGVALGGAGRRWVNRGNEGGFGGGGGGSGWAGAVGKNVGGGVAEAARVSRAAAGPGAWRAPTREGGPSIRSFKNLNFKSGWAYWGCTDWGVGGVAPLVPTYSMYRRRQRGTPEVGLGHCGHGGGGRQPDLGAVV